MIITPRGDPHLWTLSKGWGGVALPHSKVAARVEHILFFFVLLPFPLRWLSFTKTITLSFFHFFLIDTGQLRPRAVPNLNCRRRKSKPTTTPATATTSRGMASEDSASLFPPQSPKQKMRTHAVSREGVRFPQAGTAHKHTHTDHTTE